VGRGRRTGPAATAARGGFLAALAAGAMSVAGAVPAAGAVLAPDAAYARAGHVAAETASGCAGPATQVIHGTPWAEAYLDAGLLRSYSAGAGQVVAVVDSGVSAAAPALAGSVLPGASMVHAGPGNTDCLGEGTFVAGLIVAHPMPGTGLAGLAPAARILPVAVTAASGQASSRAVAAGIRYAVASGATVIDVSLTTPPGPSATLLAAVRYAQARNVVVVAGVPAGGSVGTVPANTVGYPAAYPGVLAVSAVGSGGAPVSAGAAGVRVDLAAPGAGLVSVGPAGAGNIQASGAGLASAFVAAAAALVRSYLPGLTAAQVIHRLEATADPLGAAVPDPQVGYGAVDPYAALTAVLPEEWGGRAPARPVVTAPRLPARPVRSGWPLAAGVLMVGLSALLTAGLAVALHVGRHGRGRRWRSAASP
jgi:membrane-anchored mycosin MYCP